ncbi:hypothetical protein [Roseovarius aestuariivivens]|uniref:hypothetical protein n=1 Tax=Roseovarius aestuariivivens TaxID=1888910 RepID=UPI001080DCD9|nr:hypothetical protein [Roseovarius aestuariivivens]
MKQCVLTLATSLLLAVPVSAQDTETEPGTSLMERGAELFFEGFRREMEPALDDLRALAENMQPALRQFIDEMGPAFADLLQKIDDFSAYHPPEMLPNGDIIIRRKTPEEMDVVPPGEDIEI